MTYLFLGAAPDAAPQTAATHPTSSQRDGRHPLRIILLGSRPDIIITIKNLHRRGFAEANEWSQPIPCSSAVDVARILSQRQPDDQISILTRLGKLLRSAAKKWDFQPLSWSLDH